MARPPDNHTAQTAAGPVSATTSLLVAQVDPQLSVGIFATTIQAGQSVTITPNLTLPPNATLQGYLIDWGDGTTDSTFTHTYAHGVGGSEGTPQLEKGTTRKGDKDI